MPRRLPRLPAPGQERVQLPDDRRALADGRADALDGAAADVADGEDAFDPDLERQREAVGGLDVGSCSERASWRRGTPPNPKIKTDASC